MKMTFRWYGVDDCISLEYIKQMQCMTGVVTAIYDVPVGEVWELDRLLKLKSVIEKSGLTMEVIESIPVHEDIKLGREDTRDKYIEVFKQNVINCAKAGVKVVCYNFMPVFDWLRTDLYYMHKDGSTSLGYRHKALEDIDPKTLSLPGWDESYTPSELSHMIDEFRKVSREQLFENLIYFLKKVMPTCDETGVNLAIHPSDPPWSLFGLPRVICCEEDYDRLFREIPNKHNGITFCTGSLGAGLFNDLPKLAAKFADRIFFCHLRQLTHTSEEDFYENGHLTETGSVNVYGIVKALVDNGFDGYIRPDHGRNIWGEEAKPGYGLYDRGLGAYYIYGLFEALEKVKNQSK